MHRAAAAPRLRQDTSLKSTHGRKPSSGLIATKLSVSIPAWVDVGGYRSYLPEAGSNAISKRRYCFELFPIVANGDVTARWIGRSPAPESAFKTTVLLGRIGAAFQFDCAKNRYTR
jgi:hypothetical protein